MFKKVVWATDGSGGADGAMAVATTLVKDAGGELVAVHCEEFTIAGKGGGSFPVHADEDELKLKIERQVEELSSDGVQATLRLARSRVGGAAHAVAEIAESEHADLIVVGTRGHTPLTGLLIGSVAQRLLHLATCPVLVVPARKAA